MKTIIHAGPSVQIVMLDDESETPASEIRKLRRTLMAFDMRMNRDVRNVDMAQKWNVTPGRVSQIRSKKKVESE